MRSYRDMVQCPGFYLCSNIHFLNPHKRLNPRQQDASQHYMLSWNIKHWSMPTIYLFIYLSIPSLSNSFIHSFIYLFIHSFNYLISKHIIYIGNYIHYIYIVFLCVSIILNEQVNDVAFSGIFEVEESHKEKNFFCRYIEVLYFIGKKRLWIPKTQNATVLPK